MICTKVTHIDRDGVEAGDERIRAATVLWAAGVEASAIGRQLGTETDRQGKVLVEADLSLKQHPNVFVIGDMAHLADQSGQPLPGTAPVAMQEERFVAHCILRDLRQQPREPFHFVDKGQMATIGQSRAIVELGRLRIAGWLAWVLWLIIHIYYLTGFKNRLLVVAQWAWSYLTFSRGSRLIVDKEWRFGESDQQSENTKQEAAVTYRSSHRH